MEAGSRERDWVIGVNRGDERCFRALFDLYAPAVYSYALSLLKSREAAEEIVQDIFLKIWTLKPKLDPDKSFKSFLFTMARNAAFNMLSQAMSQERLRERLFSVARIHDVPADQQVLEKENDDLQRRAFDALPEKRREIFRMARNEGMSYEEIATKLGISVNTVRNQMSRALDNMRTFLQIN